MDIDKAIEILDTVDKPPLPPRDTHLWSAIRLGKEALKAIKDFREDWSANRFHHLPGETEFTARTSHGTLIHFPSKKGD